MTRRCLPWGVFESLSTPGYFYVARNKGFSWISELMSREAAEHEAMRRNTENGDEEEDLK